MKNPTASPATGFTLSEAGGNAVSLHDFRGKICGIL